MNLSWPTVRDDPQSALDARSKTFFYAEETLAMQEGLVGETTQRFIAILVSGAPLLGVGLALMELLP